MKAGLQAQGQQPAPATPAPAPASGDGFDKLANGAAGLGDTISGGLTKRIRGFLSIGGVGLNDGIDPSSSAYQNGQLAGMVYDFVAMFVNPCRAATTWAANGWRAFNGVQAAGGTLNGLDKLKNGDLLGAAGDFLGAFFSALQAGRTCFVAGTPILTPNGWLPIEQLKEGDLVLSRPEGDMDGPVEPRVVEETFARHSVVVNLRVAGRLIQTTGEHPFFVQGRGWTPAGSLIEGDLLATVDGRWIVVTGVSASDLLVPVYNVRVAEYHTYFVGAASWGFGVWAHNAECFHYTSDSGIKGMNASRKISASVPGYGGHGVSKPVVFVTPLSPAELAKKGVKALGLTREKAKNVVPLDIPMDQLRRIPGGKGAYIWYHIGDVPLPKKGPFHLPTGL